MKKLKKLLAGVIALAMAMSMMTMTAFATETTELDLTGPAINPAAKGSLTIHKKDFDESKWTEEERNQHQGTGEKADESKVPSGASALGNVTFEIYLVETDFSKFYSENPTGSFEATSYYETTKVDGKDVITVKDGKGSTMTEATDSGTTLEGTGEVAFTNLTLGVYLVLETDAPDSVSKPTAPFLVSIPTTKADGSGWLYDVHVYPKNATYAMDQEIMLIKYGKTAGVDDSEKSGLNNVEFWLQKATKINADGTVAEWTNITHPASKDADNDKSQGALVLKTAQMPVNGENTDGVIKVSGLSAGKYRFVEKEIHLNLDENGNNKNGGYIKDGATSYIFEIVANAAGKLEVVYTADNAVRTDDGLVDTATETFADGSTHPHFEVVNEKPKFEKNIVGTDGKKTSDDTNSEYGVGDIIPYEIEIGVPEKITKMKTFYLNDTPKNLEIVMNTVKVYDGGTELKPEDGFDIQYVDALTAGYATKFTLTFDMPTEAKPDATLIQGLGGKTITIKYQAKVLEAAAGGAEDPTTNKVQLIYSDKILPDGDDNPNHDDEEKVYVREDQEVSNTYKFKVVKYADSKNGDKLKDVEFDLYKEVPAGTAGVITDEEAAKYGLTVTENTKWLKVNKESLKTDANGVVEQKSLGNGTYYLVETKTNDGYNLLEEPFEVTLNLHSTTTVTKKWTKVNKFEDGELTVDGAWVEQSTVTITYTNDGEGTEPDGIFDQDVINRRGFTLPSTGGMGTFLFTFVGVAMMAAAVILFFTSKKKEAK